MEGVHAQFRSEHHGGILSEIERKAP